MNSSDKTSPIILGTMQFLWTTTKVEATRILDAYVDLGGHCIDTANVYTNWADGLRGGEAETIIGQWLRQHSSKRDELHIMTKVGSRMWDGEDGEGLGKPHLLKALDGSLKRLQTEYVDVYMLHAADIKTPIEETLDVMHEFLIAGKITSIGFSNFSVEQTKDLLIKSSNRKIPVTYMQAYYNLVNRKTFEAHFTPLLKDYQLTVHTYGSLASGFLSGAYRPNLPLPDHARSQFAQAQMTEQNMRILSVLDEMAQKYNKSVAQVSLAWLTKQPLVGGAIIGADTVQQLQQNFIFDNSWLEADDEKVLSEVSNAT